MLLGLDKSGMRVLLTLGLVGVHQNAKLPNHDERGDGERWGRVGSLQAAVPGVDRKGPDTRSGQSAHKGESGYVSS